MFFERIKTPGLAHNAYLMAFNKTGIIVDPRRDIDEYLEIARENGIDIRFVLLTHRQEDFILGASELEDLLGAELIGGDHEFFHYCDRKLKDGEIFMLEGLTIKALHTPGHTPESMSYAVFLEGRANCWGVFTGDALFIGDAGRTDLQDKQKTAENAALLYDSIQKKLKPLGPQTQLWPAHGAGSICGGKIADLDVSTLGFEAQYNPAFVLNRDEFIRSKVHERIPRPPYFKNMEEANNHGGLMIRGKIDSVRIMSPKDFSEESRKGIVIDTRQPEAFAGGHIENSFSIWLDGLSIYAGWIAQKYTSIYLILERNSDLPFARKQLGRIGIDNVKGLLEGGFESWRNEGLPFKTAGSISTSQLQDDLSSYEVLDVRRINEFEDEGHITNAKHCFVGHLQNYLKKQEFQQPLVVTCSVGHRASLAVSILLREGYKEVSNLLGGMMAWKKGGLFLNEGPINPQTPSKSKGPLPKTSEREPSAYQ